MSQDQDHLMDDSERGHVSTPGRLPRNRLRSASPRTLQCSSCGRGRRDTSTPKWKWNPVHECIVHSASGCTTCRDYMLHLNKGAMDDNMSYVDAGAKHSASDSLRDRLHETEQEVDSLRCEVHDMETRLHAQNSALSYTTVTKSQRPALAPAKRTNVASKPTFILKVTNVPQAVAPPMVSPTPKPLKGKAVALPTMDYEVSLAYDDDEYGSDFDPTENAAEEAKAIDSPTG
ncbi:hypothetical protein PILCRDRAFT_7508 [Piloderma croceum F 1598]|uniref:Uncharacterized protein n=1 Tax=Piloderma croceum (strain F 1598) TaxID=765440 RepID=A0A0C3FUL3_PILCF|nr:hypothetical protein PILCRDRAFT_7508 [Piloderma croceum F 1598]